MSDSEVAVRIWHLLDGKAKATAVDALTTFLGNVREQHAAELREAVDLLREGASNIGYPCVNWMNNEKCGKCWECRANALLARNPGGDR
jgi:hypothetical protein